MKKLLIGLLSLACVFSAQSADRLVVAGGSLSELIYAMGIGNRVVGVDETTSYPPETAALPHIGYWKQLSSEGILSLHQTALSPGRMLALKSCWISCGRKKLTS